MKISLLRNHSGSTLLIALASMATLAMIAGVMITRVNTSYRAAYHSTSWEEAFRAAECGADLAFASLDLSADSTTAATAWTGWTGSAATGYTKTFHAGSTPALPTHAGDGNTKLFARVTVAPIAAKSGWYTIRSVGTAQIPGSKSITEEASLRTTTGKKNHASNLRKINFTVDSTGGVIPLPQTSRTVELVAYPSYDRLFTNALTTKNQITLSGGAIIDSFDSGDPLKSTNGRYDVTKRQANGDIATNSNGNLTNLSNNVVRGDAMSNQGTMQGTGGVTGQIVNNFNTTLDAVIAPDWTGQPYTIDNTYNTSKIVTAAAGSTQSTPTRIKTNTINIGSHDAIVIANGNVASSGLLAPAYIDIYVTGDMKTNAQASITVSPNVNVRFYVAGNVDIGAGGVTNGTGYAANVQMYGIDPPAGTTRTFDMTGQADFTGVVYAPAFIYDFTGGGNIYGAVVAKTARLTGNSGFHYDEALGSLTSGTIQSYQMATWVEDIR